MELETLIKEVLRNQIPISGVEYDARYDSLVYLVDGFSKSGCAKVYSTDDKILCKTRYNTINEIASFEDLMRVAFEWNSGYAESYRWNSSWLPLFEAAGLVKITTDHASKVEVQ